MLYDALSSPRLLDDALNKWYKGMRAMDNDIQGGDEAEEGARMVKGSGAQREDARAVSSGIRQAHALGGEYENSSVASGMPHRHRRER